MCGGGDKQAELAPANKANQTKTHLNKRDIKLLHPKLVQQIQKTITPDRLPGVAQVAPNPAPLYSPVPATKAVKAVKVAKAAKVPTSSRPRYVNLGHQYAPAPAPELGTSYSEDQIFREEEKNLEDESLVRRQAFLGPQIPILRNIMDFNFPSYNFE